MADAAPYDQLIPGIGYEFHDVTNLFLEAASGERFLFFFYAYLGLSGKRC